MKAFFFVLNFWRNFDMKIEMNECIKRLIEHEGLCLKPYRCSMGKLTIGIGRNLEDNPLNFEEKKALGDYMHGITENGAKMLLRNDINRCVEELKNTIKGFDELEGDRQYALLDMCFQLGINGLKKFRIMRRAIENKDFNRAYEACLKSKYAKQVPLRAKRIAGAIRYGVWR